MQSYSLNVNSYSQTQTQSYSLNANSYSQTQTQSYSLNVNGVTRRRKRKVTRSMWTDHYLLVHQDMVTAGLSHLVAQQT